MVKIVPSVLIVLVYKDDMDWVGRRARFRAEQFSQPLIQVFSICPAAKLVEAPVTVPGRECPTPRPTFRGPENF